MKTIVIYRSALLPPTQTFIPFQAEAIEGYLVKYVGLEAVHNGFVPPREPIYLAVDKSLKTRLRKNIFKLTGFAPTFRRRVASLNPCLVHAHFLMDGIHALPLATSLHIPLVVTLHGHVPTSGGRTIGNVSLDGMAFNIRRQTLSERCSLFICVSEYIRQKAIQLGYPKQKLRLHYIGVDLDKFTAGNEKRDPQLVLFVGRLAEKKGCTYLIRAMSKVQQQVPGAHLVVVGDGPQRSMLEQESASLNVNVRFAGEQPLPTVLSWLRRARVFCGPSVTAGDGDTEALGMVFAEAQATGLPVVSFCHGGIPEVVIDGKTGLLAPERDIEKLADNIIRYLNDDALWSDSSANGVAWVKERFDLRKQTRELEQIYSSLVGATST